MGSNQSSHADRNNGHARHGRLSSSHQREKNKTTLAPNVNSGRAYEHLACTNDNSARSSPLDVRSSSISLKDVERKKSSSVACFPCFRCISNEDELRSRGVPNPGQNNDSVALLRVSSKSSLRAVELDDENSFSPEKSERRADEKPSDENLGDDTVEEISCNLWTRSQRVEYVNDVDCAHKKVYAKEAVASEVVVKGNGICCEKPVRPNESDSDFDQTGRGRPFVVSKKHLSFPYGLFSHARSKPIVEGYNNSQLTTMPVRKQSTERGNEWVKEVDCMSNSTSYEDSGKASESESGLLFLEPGRNVSKAPIAKIDSLETTSIDSLNSDDLMMDTMGFSCTSFKELEGSRDPDYTESADRMSTVCRNQKLNNSVHARHGSAKGKAPERGRPSCSSLSEPKLNKRQANAFDRNEPQHAVNDVLAGEGGTVTLRETADRSRRVKSAIPAIPGAGERKRFSCPSTAAEMPFLCFDNLRPTSLDLTGTRRFSDTIQEMPDMPVGDEFVVLDRETQEELSNDIETCRALLLNLGVLICQDEMINSSYLDSKNNNLSYFSMQEEVGKNSLQTAEMTEGSLSYEQLAMENNELKTKMTSLQTLMIEQQKLITSLENKLAQLPDARQKAVHNVAVADIHSTPLATSG